MATLLDQTITNVIFELNSCHHVLGAGHIARSFVLLAERQSKDQEGASLDGTSTEAWRIDQQVALIAAICLLY